MALKDQALPDFLAILELGDYSEDIEYQEFVDGLGPPRAMKAILREGDALEPLDLGASTRGGARPIVARVSRDPVLGLLQVNEGRDRLIRWPGTPRETPYLVQKDLDPERRDQGAWRLYCTA